MCSRAPSTEPAMRRHETLYFDDGDIVLCATDTQSPEVLYRLDKALLSRHSPVFAGMFSLPSAPEANDKYDGVPLARLSGDCPSAVEELFKFMYNPASLVFRRADRNSSMRFKQLLEAAHKYQVESAKQFVVRQLENDWPVGIDAWLRQLGDVQQGMGNVRSLVSAGLGKIETAIVDIAYPEPACVIHICTKYDIPSILPSAFYLLAQIEVENDWDMYHGGQWNTLTSEKSAPAPIPYSEVFHFRTARWGLLDGIAFRRVLIGRKELRRRGEKFGDLYVAATHKKSSRHSPECIPEIARLRTECQTAMKSTSDPPWPLEKLASMLSAPLPKLCSSCRKATQDRIAREMDSLWKDLPRIFSLGKVGAS